MPQSLPGMRWLPLFILLAAGQALAGEPTEQPSFDCQTTFPADLDEAALQERFGSAAVTRERQAYAQSQCCLHPAAAADASKHRPRRKS